MLFFGGCTATSEPLGGPTDTTVRLGVLWDASHAWHVPPPTPYFLGGRLLVDVPRPASLVLAVTRAIAGTNRRLAPLDALLLVEHALGVARSVGLDPAFFACVLMQESGFDPAAHSSAGAVGIAQFTIDTADAYGVDPFDWRDAMRGSAHVFVYYLARYRAYPDRYAVALAAYNAGPGAVAYYHGVPPYAETRAYISDVYDRWSRLERDQRVAERRVARNAFEHWVNRF